MFRSNGIFRDVLLYKTGKNSIYDFEAKISFNGKYSLDFIPSLKLSDECTLTVLLYDDEKLITSKSVNVSPSDIQKLALKILMFILGLLNVLIFMI